MKIMTDSPIRFPGLFGDWAITISSKAIDIGNGIYWYGILIALGMLVALWWCMRQRTKYGIREDDLIDGLLWGIPSAIVGARLYYVLFYLSEFKDHEGHFSWSKAIAIWDGGLAIYGGVIAVVIVAIILCRSRHIKLGAMMDLVVMGLLIGQAIGRWGNFLNREAFGAETALPWRMQLTTTAGELVEVHPTFLYESLWNVIGLLLIIFVVSKARRFDGENTCFYFLWYGVGRFWIEGLRTDALMVTSTLRTSQLVALVSVATAVVLLVAGLQRFKGAQLMVPLQVSNLKKLDAAGTYFVVDELPASASHREFVRATAAMNRRLEEFDLDEAEKVEDNNDNGEAIEEGNVAAEPQQPAEAPEAPAPEDEAGE